MIKADFQEILKHFFNLCREEKIEEASIRAIPYIGDSIREYMGGDNLELLINDFNNKHCQQQDAILKEVNKLVKESEVKSLPIITIGNGNVEYVIDPVGPVKRGEKHTAITTELYGGSCLNFSFRLLNTQHEVYPIPLIGQDRPGDLIQKEFIKVAGSCCPYKNAVSFIKSDDFQIPSLKTQIAHIVIENQSRTLFADTSNKGGELSKKAIIKRIESLDKLINNYKTSIVIGHIYLDGKSTNDDLITKHIIDKYFGRAFLYSNFGSNQIKYGFDFWKKHLRKLNVFQLNLEEFRQLFKDASNISLAAIVKKLQNNEITAVITVEDWGAIATYKNGRHGIIHALPLNINKVVDPTGAGDAFGAGIVSILKGRKSFSFNEFHKAVDVGRTWASFACKTIGGSGKDPSQENVYECAENEEKFSNEPIKVYNKNKVEDLLYYIDKAHP